MTQPIQSALEAFPDSSGAPAAPSQAQALERKPMTAMRIRLMARDVVDELSPEQRRNAVDKVFEEIMHYAKYSEPDIDRRLLPDILGYWVEEKVMKPSPDLFLSCLQCVSPEERMGLVRGTAWQQWLTSIDVRNDVIAAIKSMPQQERASVLRALIPAAGVDGMSSILDEALSTGFEAYAIVMSACFGILSTWPAQHRDALLERMIQDMVDFSKSNPDQENYAAPANKLLLAIKGTDGDSAGRLFAKWATLQPSSSPFWEGRWPRYLINMVCSCPSAIPAFQKEVGDVWTWAKIQLDTTIRQAQTGNLMGSAATPRQ